LVYIVVFLIIGLFTPFFRIAMLRKEYEVIRVFEIWPWRSLTFREVKESSGKKSEGYVYNSLKKFVKEGVLAQEKAGNVVLYRLNLPSVKAQAYAGFIAEYAAWSNGRLPLRDLERIASRIPTGYYSLLVTGSYAKNMQKKGSDIDVVVVCDDCQKPDKIYAELRHDCEMNIPPIHPQVFRKSEFLAMLLDAKPNFGRETAKSNLILSGGKEYYTIIAEAVQHGFNG